MIFTTSSVNNKEFLLISMVTTNKTLFEKTLRLTYIAFVTIILKYLTFLSSNNSNKTNKMLHLFIFGSLLICWCGFSLKCQKGIFNSKLDHSWNKNNILIYSNWPNFSNIKTLIGKYKSQLAQPFNKFFKVRIVE